MRFLIRLSPFFIVLSVLALAGCQPAAFPRTAEVAPRGHITSEVAIQAVAYEPQRVVNSLGRPLGSNVAFFPIISGAVRVGFGGCEGGGVYAMTRLLGEIRCGLLQERRGAPFSLALSGAFGLDYGPYLGPVARIGLDASVRLGPLRPLVNVYLSSSRELRYVEDHAPEVPPIEGPMPAAATVQRNEIRITVPLGLAIELYRPPPGDSQKLTVSLVLGATPYHVLKVGPCRDCAGIRSWSADYGAGFTIGLEMH